MPGAINDLGQHHTGQGQGYTGQGQNMFISQDLVIQMYNHVFCYYIKLYIDR